MSHSITDSSKFHIGILPPQRDQHMWIGTIPIRANEVTQVIGRVFSESQLHEIPASDHFHLEQSELDALQKMGFSGPKNQTLKGGQKIGDFVVPDGFLVKASIFSKALFGILLDTHTAPVFYPPLVPIPLRPLPRLGAPSGATPHEADVNRVVRDKRGQEDEERSPHGIGTQASKRRAPNASEPSGSTNATQPFRLTDEQWEKALKRLKGLMKNTNINFESPDAKECESIREFVEIALHKKIKNCDWPQACGGDPTKAVRCRTRFNYWNKTFKNNKDTKDNKSWIYLLAKTLKLLK